MGCALAIRLHSSRGTRKCFCILQGSRQSLSRFVAGGGLAGAQAPASGCGSAPSGGFRRACGRWEGARADSKGPQALPRSRQGRRRCWLVQSRWRQAKGARTFAKARGGVQESAGAAAQAPAGAAEVVQSRWRQGRQWAWADGSAGGDGRGRRGAERATNTRQQAPHSTPHGEHRACAAAARGRVRARLVLEPRGAVRGLRRGRARAAWRLPALALPRASA